MSDNLREFDLKVKAWGDEVPEQQVERLHRALQLEALKGVVLMTPVDEGRARGAWEMTLDTPAASESGVLDRTGGVTIGEDNGAGARVEEQRHALAVDFGGDGKVSV